MNKEELLKVYGWLLQVETKGASTILMAASLEKIKEQINSKQ